MLQDDACLAGRGEHYIEYGGYTWRTLDGVDPAVHSYDRTHAPNDGCQCTFRGHHSMETFSCPDNYLPLPTGWTVAPNDAPSTIDWDSDCHPGRGFAPPPPLDAMDRAMGITQQPPDPNYRQTTANWPECYGASSINVIAEHKWGTTCLVLADGTAWPTADMVVYPDDQGNEMPWSCYEGDHENLMEGQHLLSTCEAGTTTTGGETRHLPEGPTWVSAVGDSCPTAPSNTFTVSSCERVTRRVLARCP